MKKTHLFVLAFYLLGSTTYAQKSISLEKANEVGVNLSSIASSIQNIPLEFTEDCILSSDLSVCATSDFIFIADIRTGTFYRFDRAGKFLNRIGKSGQGPGEYSQALCFSVDDTRKQIYLIDSFVKKVLVYSYEGDYLRTIPLEVPTYMFVKNRDLFYYYDINYLRSKYELYQADSNGKIVKRAQTEDKIEAKFSLQMPFFYQFDGNLYYKNTASEIIWQIDNSLNKKPVYIIDLGKYAKKEDAREFEIQGNKARAVNKGNYRTVSDLFETDKYIFISYSQADKDCMAIYDKRKSNVCIPVCDEEYGLMDDLSDGPVVLYHSNVAAHCTSTVPNELVSILQCGDLDFNRYTQGHFADIIADLDEESNPIVRIISLK